MRLSLRFDCVADEEGQADAEGLQNLNTYWMACWREGDGTRCPPGAPERWMPRRSMLIELTRGKHAIVDVNDADLAGRSWHAVPGHHSIGNYTFFAACRKGNKRVAPHWVILEHILGRHLLDGEECDHIDGNGMNNKRCNLRLVDHRRNIRNSHGRQHITMAGKERKQLKLNSVSHQDNKVKAPMLSSCILTTRAFNAILLQFAARDIETATGLRQPEVRIAMQTLRERNWLTENEIKCSGKGRPLKIYALRATIDEIIN